MAGIYIHIPFCKQACTYCDFHFITSLRRKDEMIAAMCKEIEMRKDFFSGDVSIQSVYLGGGTPSILDRNNLNEIFSTLKQYFHIDKDAEITLEANPDDLKAEKLNEFRDLGINRLSIGIQSLDDRELKWMNRSHSADEARNGIQLAKKTGFDHISVDLIFGTPFTTPRSWEQLLHEITEQKIPHLSVYALTVEERTALYHWMDKGRIHLPDDSIYESLFLLTHELLTRSGYDHYELSNYALPGHYARHNSAYWKGIPYLGIGPSAHAYDGYARVSNVANNSKYLSMITGNNLPVDYREELTIQDRYNEYIMIHLRKAEGIDMELIRSQFQYDPKKQYGSQICNWIREGLMIKDERFYRLTPKGWFVSDRIISKLFRVGIQRKSQKSTSAE